MDETGRIVDGEMVLPESVLSAIGAPYRERGDYLVEKKDEERRRLIEEVFGGGR